MNDKLKYTNRKKPPDSPVKTTREKNRGYSFLDYLEFAEVKGVMLFIFP